MSDLIVPVVLSGGSGTRLWPVSTAQRPKQFLPLVGDESLFRQTLSRVSDRDTYAASIIVANAAHRDLCLNELVGHQGARLFLEPCARNTAVAIAMAARLVEESQGPDTLILVMPSDHLIGDLSQFHAAVATGKLAAASSRLVTFGITPRHPETGYGYLAAGEELQEAPGSFEVTCFTEKPDVAAAGNMLASGRHYWNGGIFLFRAGDFLREASTHAPVVHATALAAIASAARSELCYLPSLAELDNCPNVSVDNAIMERSSRVAMVPLSAAWSDVGSWDVLAAIGPDRLEQPSVAMVGTENCYVRSDGLKVAMLGVHDLVVVASGDQLLIMKKGHSQNIRQLVAQLAAQE